MIFSTCRRFRLMMPRTQANPTFHVPISMTTNPQRQTTASKMANPIVHTSTRPSLRTESYPFISSFSGNDAIIPGPCLSRGTPVDPLLDCQRRRGRHFRSGGGKQVMEQRNANKNGRNPSASSPPVRHHKPLMGAVNMPRKQFIGRLSGTMYDEHPFHCTFLPFRYTGVYLRFMEKNASPPEKHKFQIHSEHRKADHKPPVCAANKRTEVISWTTVNG